MAEPAELQSRWLCDVTVELRDGAPIVLGQTPWGARRISDIVGGHFEGPRLRGRVCPSGADWSQRGSVPAGVLTQLDVRSLWETDDGSAIYVTYGGRLAIPADVLPELSDTTKIDAVDASRYYFRTNPLFETAAENYSWMNGIVSIGIGRRTRLGVTYRVFEIL